jgi:NAD dependent epimerase/dehydratase family enzyme
VHLDDLVNVVIRSMEDESLVGAVNVVAPQAVTNREFTRELAGVLGRPAWMPAPAFGLRLLLGEMADGILLCSARVRPYRLEAAGYRFLFPELKDALGAVSAGR